jgi:lysophospholipase L1-like esterase
MRHFLLAFWLLLTFTARATVSPAPLPGDRPGQTPGGQPPATVPLLAQARVLVLGDSITQDGRYVSILEYYLQRQSPAVACDLISIGLSSETMSGLTEPGHPYPRPCVLERLDRALQAVKPQVVLACYGMNDGIYHPSSPERLAAFTSGLKQLISQVRASGARLVLITPPCFDPRPLSDRTVQLEAAAFGYPHPYVGYDQVLAEYAAVEQTLAAPDVTVIDVHTAMAGALAQGTTADPALIFSPDGVHPNDLGHLLMARVIAQGLGLKTPDSPLAAEWAELATDPIYSLVHDRRALRSEAWLPYIGYTLGTANKSNSVMAAERVAARLRREIEALATRQSEGR